MPQPIQTPKFKTLQIIHTALLTGMCLFAIVVFYLKQSTVVKFNKDDVFSLLVPFMAVMGAFASDFLFGKALPNAQKQTSVHRKFGMYQTATIMRYAFLEGPALFATIVYFLTSNFLCLLIAIAIIAYFITLRPTKDKLADDLKLSYEEQQEL